MNKYLACIGLLALCLCLSEAATRNEAERLVHQVNHQVRTEQILAIKAAAGQAMARATTQLQRACVNIKIGPANRDLNLALNQAMLAEQTRIRNLAPEDLAAVDVNDLSEQLRETYSSAASGVNGWIEQINQCA